MQLLRSTGEKKSLPILPGTGRGTTEGGGGARAGSRGRRGRETPHLPLHHASHDPPPPRGEDRPIKESATSGKACRPCGNSRRARRACRCPNSRQIGSAHV